jgi:curved DNA-binding protein CbpA
LFVDYYDILEISFDASSEEIKIAFKKQALRWHPDRNIGKDTKIKMQEINEAYLILKDFEARARYNYEYINYKSFIEVENKNDSAEFQKDNDYEFRDETLKRWMNNAKEQASEIVKQTYKEIKIGAEAAGADMINKFVAFAVIGLIFTILIKSCN